MAKEHDIYRLKRDLTEVHDGSQSLGEFLSRLSRFGLTPADIEETMESITAKSHEGLIRLGKDYVISIKRGARPFTDLIKYLEKHRLTFVDLGENESSFTQFASS